MKSDGTEPITNAEDVIDSRDVLARIEHLKSEWAESTGDDPADYSLSADDWRVGLGDDADELVALLALAKEAADYAADWEYGETLVRDSYFVDYTQQLIEDCYSEGFPNLAQQGWPFRHLTMDWEQAARELAMDYTHVDFDGVTYLIR
jgi:hypothetical protein